MSAASAEALAWFATPPHERIHRAPTKLRRDALYERGLLTARHSDALVTRLGCAALRDHGRDAAADRCAPGADPLTLGTFTVIELARGDAVLLAAVDELGRALRDRLAPRTVVEIRICRGAA